MKLLLLDRPVDIEAIRGNDIEYFGPWAQAICAPEDLTQPSFTPYPDSQSVDAAAAEAISRVELIWEPLTAAIEDIAGVRENERFWKAYLGDLVVLICSAVVDTEYRQRALPEKNYILGRPLDFHFVTPHSWNKAIELLFYGVDFNWLVMEVILSGIYKNQKSIDYKDIPAVKIPNRFESFSSRLSRTGRKRIIRRLLSSYLPGVLLRFKKRAFSSCHSLIWDDYNLEDFGFGTFKETAVFDPSLFTGWPIPVLKPDSKKRELVCGCLPHPYGRIISGVLPVEALEGLPYLIKQAKKKGIEKTFENIKRIYTHGQAFSGGGLSRLWFALLAGEGKQIISVQHGGGELYRVNTYKYLERMVADKHITWGAGYSADNEGSGAGRVKALPGIYLSALKEKNNSKKKIRWDALLLVLEEYRFVKWLYNPLFPDLARDYYCRQKTLLDYFCRQARTAVKGYPDDFGWRQVCWIKKRHPGTKVFTSGRFTDLAPQASIAVIDYNSTGFLEMLALNKPFLITWNRRWFRGNDLFEEFIDRLTQVGIFYPQPQLLIETYNNTIKPDIGSWWNNKERQKAVAEMAGNFAMTSQDFYKEWSKEFA